MSAPASQSSRYVALTVLVEALGTAKTRYVVSPVAGKVVQVFAVADVTTDDVNVLTSSIAGTAITGGAISLASGVTVGVPQSVVPTAANTVLKGQSLGVATDGGGTVGQARVTFLISQEI